MDISESISRGFGLTAESLGQGFAFGKINWKGVFSYFFVAALVMALAAVAGALIGGGVAYFTYAQIGWASASAIGVGLFLLVFVMGLSLGYAPLFGAIQFIYNNKKTGYFESSNIGTGFKWAVVAVAAIMAVALIFGGAIVSMAANPIAGMLLFLLSYFAFIVVAIFVAIFGYYMIYEASMKRMGPIAAIIASYHRIRENFWETVVFAIVVWAISYIASLFAGIVFYVFYIVAIILMFVSPVAAIAMIAFAFLVLILLEMVIHCFVFPMQVLFYKKIAEGKGIPAAKAKSKGATAAAKKTAAKKK